MLYGGVVWLNSTLLQCYICMGLLISPEGKIWELPSTMMTFSKSSLLDNGIFGIFGKDCKPEKKWEYSSHSWTMDMEFIMEVLLVEIEIRDWGKKWLSFLEWTALIIYQTWQLSKMILKKERNLMKICPKCYDGAHLSTTRKNKTLFKTICTNEHWKHPIYLPECAIRAKSPILCRKFLPCCKKALLASKYYMWQTGNGTQCRIKNTLTLVGGAPTIYSIVANFSGYVAVFHKNTLCVF